MYTSMKTLRGLACEDHYVVNRIKDTTKPAEEDISGITHWALSYRHPAAARLKKKLLHEICNEWVHVREGPPPPEAKQHLKLLLRIRLQGIAPKIAVK